MNPLTGTVILTCFLVFCRIGGCLMLMPGVGGRNLPPQVRLFLGLAVALAFVPATYGLVAPQVEGASPARLLVMIAGEVGTGALIGLLARIYILALETLASFMAQAVGLAAMPGLSVEDNAPLPTLATLFTFAAVALIFMADQHLELVRGLFDSYRRVPPGALFGTRPALVDLVDQLTAAFLLALRIASPFILYSILVNFAVGLINKFTPQIPVFFIAGPFVTAGGLLLLYASVEPLLSGFLLAFSQWLRNG